MPPSSFEDSPPPLLTKAFVRRLIRKAAKLALDDNNETLCQRHVVDATNHMHTFHAVSVAVMKFLCEREHEGPLFFH